MGKGQDELEGLASGVYEGETLRRQLSGGVATMLACVLSNFNSSTQAIQKISSPLYLMRFRVALCSHFPGDTDLVVHKRFFADSERLVHEEILMMAFSVGLQYTI